MRSIITFYNTYAKPAAATLAGLCAVAVFLYGGLLLGAVAHASKHSAAQEQTAEIQGSLASLEGTYLSYTKTLTLERARELGFGDPVSVTVVRAPQEVFSFGDVATTPLR